VIEFTRWRHPAMWCVATFVVAKSTEQDRRINRYILKNRKSQDDADADDVDNDYLAMW